MPQLIPSGLTGKAGQVAVVRSDEEGLEIVQVLDSTAISGVIPSGGSANQVLKKTDANDYNVEWGSATASVSITEVEIDVGASPVSEATVLVVDAGMTASSKVIGGIAYKAPTDKDLDELEMDALDIKFEPVSGGMNVWVKGLEGYIADKFKIWYTFS